MRCYVRKKVIAGKFTYEHKYAKRDLNNKGVPRMERMNETSEAQQNFNKKMAIQSLEWKINTNFVKGDLFVTLTYKNEPTNAERINKDIANYIRRMRAVYKEKGNKLKYIYTVGFGDKDGRVHFHIILNRFKGCEQYVEAKWQLGGVTVKHIGNAIDYGKNNNYGAGLSRYMLKVEEIAAIKYGKMMFRGYNCSQGLKKPIVETWIEEGEFPTYPEIPDGCELIEDSVYTGVDEYGEPYMSYTYIRKQPPKKRNNTKHSGKNKSRKKAARKRCR